MRDPGTSELLQFAHHLADISGEIILRYFRKPITVEDKADSTPVTQVDRETESVLRQKIAGQYPDHGVMGEEFAPVHPESDWQWVLDPIDGTLAFISGFPVFGTLIGLMHEQQPRMGIIDIPALGERWSGATNGPCLFRRTFPVVDETVCRVSNNRDLRQSVVFSTDPSMFEGVRARQTEVLFSRVKMRRFGGDCYLYGQLACGWIDLVVEADMQFYDAAALVPVVTASGGVISDWQGQPVRPGWDGTVLASASRELHSQVLALFQEVRDGCT